MKKVIVVIAIFCITNFAFSQTSKSFSSQDLKQYLNEQVNVKLKNNEKFLDTSCTKDGYNRIDYVSKVSRNYIEITCPERKGYKYKSTTRILISEISAITLLEKN
ncbi:hypothetical protein [uncultured Kordia sp.]|uniref:hypothetical protein n=1 Tax=uncultured Kordia sp. TaxID=507699 RepID=UPI00261DA577|nr:hypothetical protein [uncultured Kordia sp.]